MRTASIVCLFLVASCTAGGGRPLIIHGDSTAIASRIPLLEKFWNAFPGHDQERWWNILAEQYRPRRDIVNDGVKGQSISELLEKMSVDRRYDHETTIIYDRINSEETVLHYLETLQKAVGTLKTRHFLIMPQVPNSLGYQNPVLTTQMREINTALLRTWPENTFALAYRDQFLADLASDTTRVDGVHRNAKGQKIEAQYIYRWIERRGW